MSTDRQKVQPAGKQPVKVKLLRIKPSPFPSTGGSAEPREHYYIGHGEILLSAEYAELAVRSVRRAIDRLHQDEPSDFRSLIGLWRLEMNFNRQLMECGKAQLKSSAEPPCGQAPPSAK